MTKEDGIVYCDRHPDVPALMKIQKFNSKTDMDLCEACINADVGSEDGEAASFYYQVISDVLLNIDDEKILDSEIIGERW